VEDVAHAIALAAVDARGAGRTYNVGPAETPSVHERIEALGRATGWTGRVEVLPDGALPPFAGGSVDVRHHLECDTGRIRRELGYEEVVSLEEGLRRTAAWERVERASRTDLPALDYASEDAALARWRGDQD
jgi:nucleoside-diphosphate-sugar epimerase